MPMSIREPFLEPLLESAARWSEPEFRSLLANLPAGAYTCDADGLITYYNRKAVEIWGREPKLSHPEDRFCGSFRLYATDGSRIRHDQCWMARALTDRAPYNGEEIVIERPDGGRVTALAHANPIRDASGAVSGAVNVLVDISDRKRAEDSKDHFLATLAHELRNPLAPIRNAVEILQREGAPGERATWALDVIERQVGQMARLIEDLMDLSRITRDRLELRRERVLLSDIIAASVETSRPLVEASGQDLTVAAPGQPILLDADPTRLAQALSNLINNAAKFGERGGRIAIQVSRQGSEAFVRVRDTGIGFEPEVREKIFEMFAQADRSRSAGGLGIGLTLVKRLVELHGGAVEAHSEGPGRGSEFLLRLPIAAEARRAAVPARPAAPAAARLRVLVVDDNRDAAQSLAMFLELLGNEVRTAHDGPEALAVAEDYRPDAILMDIGLPGMNGYEAARSIRSRPWGKAPTLVAVTGWGQDEDRQRSAEAGFDHHVVKPVDPDVLAGLLAPPARI